MTYKAEIDIMPLKELLDPQGKAATRNLRDVDITGVESIRIGKHVRMVLEAETEEQAKEKVETACTKLLANAIMESFTYEISAME